MQELIEKLLAYAAPRIKMRSECGVQLGQVDGPVTVVNVYLGKSCDCCHAAEKQSPIKSKTEK